jgi:hypothetical protein
MYSQKHFKFAPTNEQAKSRAFAVVKAQGMASYQVHDGDSLRFHDQSPVCVLESREEIEHEVDCRGTRMLSDYLLMLTTGIEDADDHVKVMSG